MTLPKIRLAEIIQMPYPFSPNASLLNMVYLPYIFTVYNIKGPSQVCLISPPFYFRIWGREIQFNDSNETEKEDTTFKILGISPKAGSCYKPAEHVLSCNTALPPKSKSRDNF